jgi:GR25 family glycosyltransferase involved in LPS biosynthesis
MLKVSKVSKILVFVAFLLFLSILLLIYYNTYDSYDSYDSYDDIPSIPIDMVYTWVDYNDKDRVKYQKMLLKNKDENLDDNRYIQNEELKYSLRSVEKNCPWIRKIYIVVKDGQYPSFLDFSNKEKIEIVNHSEIMPPTSIPTFNSIAIESCIHKIPSLSDYYIYMNDDFFIMKPLKKSDVIGYKYNQPTVYVDRAFPNSYEIEQKNNDIHSYFTMFNNSIILANKMTRQNLYVYMVHLPSFCYKPWDKEIETRLRNIKYKDTDLWNYNVHLKFRANDSVALNCCIRPIYYMYKGAIPTDLAQYHLTMNLKKENCSTDFSLNKVKFLCINEINNDCRNNFKKFINKYFMNRSIFEYDWGFLEKAVYINLENRKDRKQEIENELVNKIPTDKIIRFNAIRDKIGHIGCSKSHINVLEIAIKNNWRNILIIEDDAMFHKYKNGYHILEKLIETHPNFDVITLGNVSAEFDKKTMKLYKGQTTTAYIVNQHYYQRLLKNFKDGLTELSKAKDMNAQDRFPYEQKYCLDQYWKNLQKIDNWYIVNPALMIQRPSNSSIQDEVVDYTLYFNL